MSLCVCGHLGKAHVQFDDGEKCVMCSCDRYRKAADSEGMESTAILSAGGSPEGLARETVSPSVNEAAERLRVWLEEQTGYHPDHFTELLDAALATERRNTVERIKREFRRPENMLTSFNAYTPGEPQGFIKAYTAEVVDRILDEVAS